MQLDDLLAPTLAAGARWSVAVRRDGDGDAVVSSEPSLLLRTASVAKVFVLLELAQRLADGTIDPDRLVDRDVTPPVHDSGLWHALRVPALPVADLAVLVGAVSDNWATNALLHVCGLDRVQALAASLAPGGSMLTDLVRDERGAAHPPTLSVGCAQDWVTIVQRLQYAHDLDPDVCRRVTGWLAHDTDVSMVASAFGLDPLAHVADDLGLRLWHKTGTDTGVRADIGVVRSSAATVSYAVICNWPHDDPHTRRAVLATMRAVGEHITTLL